MGLSCGMNCLKILLFVFNFIFWLLGVVVLGVGIWSRVQGASWDSLLEGSAVPNAANLMIASGVIVGVIGFFGCCGAIRKNQCMLVSYAIMIILIFILELAAGIYAYTKKDNVQQDLAKNLKKTINSSYGNQDKSSLVLKEAVDWFQKNVKCCGAEGPSDWVTSVSYKKIKKGNQIVPKSCCMKTGVADCNVGTKIKGLKIYTTGCVEAGNKFLKKHLWKIGAAAIGIGVIQLFGIIFAICLCQAIKHEDKGHTV